MPEEQRSVRKRIRLEKAFCSEQDELVLQIKDGQDVYRRKHKKRRTIQSKDSKLLQIEQFFQKGTLVFTSSVFLILGNYCLRFLHVNSAEFEERFVRDAEAATNAKINLTGLAFSPLSWSFSDLSFEADNQLVKKLQLSKGVAGDKGFGILGFAWRGEDIVVEKAKVGLDFQAAKLFNFNDEILPASFRFFRAKECSLISGSDQEIVVGSSLLVNKEKLLFDEGKVNIPYFGLTPLVEFSIENYKDKWSSILVMKLDKENYKLMGEVTKNRLMLKGGELVLPLSRLKSPLFLWSEGQLNFLVSLIDYSFLGIFL
jgi:hypothetical protein